MVYRICEFRDRKVYHLVNRGGGKQGIFFSTDDYEHWKVLMDRHSRGRVDVIAYAVLPNHFHILARQLTGEGVERFMRYLQQSYSRYLGKTRNMKGQVYEGNFFASQIKNQRHYYNVLDYIVRNPTKHKMSNLGIGGRSGGRGNIVLKMQTETDRIFRK
jgi:REP element-mobilizing transposase RayT